MPQKQQGARLDAVQRRGDLPDGDRGGDGAAVEGEDEHGACRVAAEALGGIGPDVRLNPEVLSPAVDVRGAGVRVHRLEADAELPDLGEVPGLPALADPADAAHVGLGEGPAVMPYLQPVGEELEGQLGRARVLGVLDQLEDEVGPLAVELPEQVQHRGVPAVAGDVLVADLPVVGRHRAPSVTPSRQTPTTAGGHMPMN